MEAIVGLIAFGLLVMWIGWPVAAFADAENLEIWQALLIFLLGSTLIYLAALVVTFLASLVLSKAVNLSSGGPDTVAQQPSPTAPTQRTMRSIATSQQGNDCALLPDHAVHGHRVKAYETHRISGDDFLFAIIPWPHEKYRIYILRSPGYRGRPKDAHSTHRYRDGQRHYICVDPSAYPDTLTAARELALMWAQATARYIKTGKKFG